jgi:glycosyltransferase involved in cell wall biosynthesis
MRKGLTVHFPLYDSQPSRADQVVFRLMERVLQEFAEAKVSVACGHKWSRSSRQLLKKLKHKYNNRLITYAAPDPYERLELFAKADLTVWAPRFESFALIGLSSLAMCTPVISWDIQPQTEYLQAWKNSVLVPCETSDNWLGIPEVVGGYQQFEEQMLATLHDRALLAKLKGSATNGLDTRRKNFDAAWLDFLRKD